MQHNEFCHAEIRFKDVRRGGCVENCTLGRFLDELCDAFFAETHQNPSFDLPVPPFLITDQSRALSLIFKLLCDEAQMSLHVYHVSQHFAKKGLLPFLLMWWRIELESLIKAQTTPGR